MTLLDVTSVALPRRCADEVNEHLRRVGRDGHEGLGLWAGVQHGARFEVTHAIIPAQRHVRTGDGVCVIVEAAELHRVNVRLYRERLALLGQVHSHPGRAYHSSTDDRYAVATAAGCLSLVVPDFAARPFDLGSVATYRLDRAGRWREVRPREVRDLIAIED